MSSTLSSARGRRSTDLEANSPAGRGERKTAGSTDVLSSGRCKGTAPCPCMNYFKSILIKLLQIKLSSKIGPLCQARDTFHLFSLLRDSTLEGNPSIIQTLLIFATRSVTGCFGCSLSTESITLMQPQTSLCFNDDGARLESERMTAVTFAAAPWHQRCISLRFREEACSSPAWSSNLSCLPPIHFLGPLSWPPRKEPQ